MVEQIEKKLVVSVSDLPQRMYSRIDHHAAAPGQLIGEVPKPIHTQCGLYCEAFNSG